MVSREVVAVPGAADRVIDVQPTEEILALVEGDRLEMGPRSRRRRNLLIATGSSDSTGAVSASAIQITSTGGKTCNTGFGGLGGSGGPSGG